MKEKPFYIHRATDNRYKLSEKSKDDCSQTKPLLYVRSLALTPHITADAALNLLVIQSQSSSLSKRQASQPGNICQSTHFSSLAA